MHKSDFFVCHVSVSRNSSDFFFKLTQRKYAISVIINFILKEFFTFRDYVWRFHKHWQYLCYFKHIVKFFLFPNTLFVPTLITDNIIYIFVFGIWWIYHLNVFRRLKYVPVFLCKFLFKSRGILKYIILLKSLFKQNKVIMLIITALFISEHNIIITVMFFPPLKFYFNFIVNHIVFHNLNTVKIDCNTDMTHKVWYGIIRICWFRRNFKCNHYYIVIFRNFFAFIFFGHNSGVCQSIFINKFTVEIFKAIFSVRLCHIQSTVGLSEKILILNSATPQSNTHTARNIFFVIFIYTHF